MRITNGMMISNTLSNISRNKTKMDTLNTQLSTEKKIQRPSEDPIVAIRALRFRSTLSEIEQYLERNIPDAEAWLSTADSALGNIVKLFGDITTYCNQAINGYYDSDDKRTIVETLKAYRSQIFSDANTDYAGRTIFTGFKTDTNLTYTKEMPEESFEINQTFDSTAFDNIRKINNSVDISGITVTNVGSFDVGSVEAPGYTDAYRVRLAYDGINPGSTGTIEYYNLDEDGNKIDVNTVTATEKSVNDPDAYLPGEDEVYFIPETGEYIFGKNVYSEVAEYDGFDVTYSKTGFAEDELNPIHYFDCKDLNTGLEYTYDEQIIEYEVSFNQNIEINVQGSKVFNHDMARDLDDVINAANTVSDVENKISQLEFMQGNVEKDSVEYNNIQALIDNCNRELDFAKDELTARFSSALSLYQDHMNTVSLARADVGAREIRLQLTSDRLSNQKTTVEALKSTNEEVDVTEIAVEFAEAESIYDASLAAAGKVVKNKLIDFI